MVLEDEHYQSGESRGLIGPLQMVRGNPAAVVSTGAQKYHLLRPMDLPSLPLNLLMPEAPSPNLVPVPVPAVIHIFLF